MSHKIRTLVHESDSLRVTFSDFTDCLLKLNECLAILEYKNTSPALNNVKSQLTRMKNLSNEYLKRIREEVEPVVNEEVANRGNVFGDQSKLRNRIIKPQNNK